MSESNFIEPIPIKDTNFIVVDVETTGLSAYNDRITEIGIVHVLNGKMVSKFETLVNPGVYIPKFITELTDISNDMVFNKPSFREVYPKFIEYISTLS